MRTPPPECYATTSAGDQNASDDEQSLAHLMMSDLLSSTVECAVSPICIPNVQKGKDKCMYILSYIASTHSVPGGTNASIRELGSRSSAKTREDHM